MWESEYIPGYILERSGRDRKGEGLAFYVRKDIFVDIMLPEINTILVGEVYRPPDKSDFLEQFSEVVINSTNFDNQEVYT